VTNAPTGCGGASALRRRIRQNAGDESVSPGAATLTPTRCDQRAYGPATLTERRYNPMPRPV